MKRVDRESDTIPSLGIMFMHFLKGIQNNLGFVRTARQFWRVSSRFLKYLENLRFYENMHSSYNVLNFP
jgi:hypothetical protein